MGRLSTRVPEAGGSIVHEWPKERGAADAGLQAVPVSLLAAEPLKLTTTPHYDGYASILVVLSKVTKAELREFLTDSWRLRAPKRLIAALDSQRR